MRRMADEDVAEMWRARPLDLRHLQYAALDVASLAPCYPRLVARLGDHLDLAQGDGFSGRKPHDCLAKGKVSCFSSAAFLSFSEDTVFSSLAHFGAFTRFLIQTSFKEPSFVHQFSSFSRF